MLLAYGHAPHPPADRAAHAMAMATAATPWPPAVAPMAYAETDTDRRRLLVDYGQNYICVGGIGQQARVVLSS